MSSAKVSNENKDTEAPAKIDKQLEVEESESINQFELKKNISTIKSKSSSTKTDIGVEYAKICAERYQRNIKLYEKRFHREMEKLERMQPSAIDAFRFNRYLSCSEMKPKLQTKAKLYRFLDDQSYLTLKQKQRLRQLLEEKQA